MSIERLHLDADWHIAYRAADTGTLVVSFSPMDWPTRNVPGRFWGDSVACKLPFSWLAVDAMRPHWYAQHPWRSVRDVVRKVAERHQRVIGYGHSMGAHGALRHAHDYDADAVLAFAPQASIDPDEVGVFDNRYRAAFDPAIHRGMALTPSHLGEARCYLFHDPNLDVDAKHIEMIAGRHVRKVRVSFLMHDVIVAARGANTLRTLISESLDSLDPSVEFHRMLRAAKKRTPLYLHHLAYRALDRNHPRWAFDIASRGLVHPESTARHRLLLLRAALAWGNASALEAGVAEVERQRIDASMATPEAALLVARALRRLGRIDDALLSLDSPQIAASKHPPALRELAMLLAQTGNAGRALQILSSLCAAFPDDPQTWRQRANVLLGDPKSPEFDPAGAVACLEAALSLQPDSTALIGSYAFALERNGDVGAAHRAWTRLELMGGLSATQRARMERLAPPAGGRSLHVEGRH